jgi:hypothetical protein
MKKGQKDDMTSLEFIEKEIRELKFQINYIKSNMKKYIDFRTEGQLEIDMRQLKINHLQQIKSQLEAWHIVKNKSVDLYDIKTSQDTEEFNCDLYTEYQLTEEEFNKLKKALEVGDE